MANPNAQDIQDFTQLLNAPDDALVSAKTFKKLLRYVIRNTPVQGNGTKFSYGTTGVTISAEDGTEGGDGYPFKITLSGDGSGDVNVQEGAVNNDTIGGALDDVSPGDVIYIAVAAEGTVTNGFLVSWAITSLDLASDTEVPSDEAGPGSMTFFKLIGSLDDSGNPVNFVANSLSLVVCDNNNGDGGGTASWGSD